MATDSDSEYRESSSEHEAAASPTHNLPSASATRQRAPIHTRKKRRKEEHAGPPPLKRIKSGFNVAYLNLLNQDIQDASTGLIHDQKNPEFGHTQIGEVVWSAAEKNVFFAAVSRLGKGDVAGIAARIGTKSEPEVRQYLVLLDATKQRRCNEEKGAQRSLMPADIPAAVEIGAECAAALEKAADELAQRQEAYEEEVEKERWGEQWLITAPLAQILEDSFLDRQEEHHRPPQQPPKKKRRLKDEEHQKQNPVLDKVEQDANELPFLKLLSIQNWLQLPDRVFMNSAMPDGNWHALSKTNEPPAIRATVFTDFYGLTLSITKRLVLASMYVADSRIRTKNLDTSIVRAGPRVKVKDVAAAISSLGIENSRREFWARCARRLQLNVVNDSDEEGDSTDQEDKEADTEGDSDTDTGDSTTTTMSQLEHEIDHPEWEAWRDENNYEVMEYDEVEAALGYPAVNNMHDRPGTPDSDMSSTTEYVSSSDGSDSDGEDREELDRELNDEDIKMGGEQEVSKHEPDEEGLNEVAIAQEIEEAMEYLMPMEYTVTEAAPTRHAIKSRIRAEHKMERDAEREDLKASADAEADLWAVLCGNSNSETKDHKGRSRVTNRGDHGEREQERTE